MVQKQVYRKLGGVRNHPGSFWGARQMSCSEQCPILIPRSGWAVCSSPAWCSCREAARSCDCTGSLGMRETEKKAAGGYTVMSLCAAAFSSQLVSVVFYPHPSLENLCEEVYKMSSLAMNFSVSFSSHLWNLEFITIYIFPLKPWRGL